MINLEATIMEEGDRTMDQFPTDRHAMQVTDIADLQQNTQPPTEAASIELTGASPSSALSEGAREWGMSCPKCHGQNATPFMSWTISVCKMTVAAIANMGLSESGMSAPMAERIEVIHAIRSPKIDAGLRNVYRSGP